MTKARTLADFISDGSPLADGTISVSEVSGAAPLASPSFTGNLTVDNNTLFVDAGNNRIGIGTASPGRLLTLYENDQPVFQITNDTSGTANTRGLIQYIANGTTDAVFDNQGSGSGGMFRFMQAGTERLRMATSEFVANESGSDYDFRVESDSNTHMLFVDAGNDAVGIGGPPDSNYSLDITGNLLVDGYNGQLAITGGGYTLNPTAMVLGQYTTTRGYIQMPTSGGSGAVEIWDGGTNVIASFGMTDITMNTNGIDRDFRVESDSKTHILFVDAGNNRLGINTSAPEVDLDIVRNSSNGFSNTQDQRGQMALTLRNGSEANGRFVGMNLIAGGGAQSDWSISNIWQSNYVGKLAFKTRTGANSTDWRQLFAMTANNEAVFNEDSTNFDFRVESDNNANMLFVDAGQDRVKVGTSTSVLTGPVPFQVGAMGIRTTGIGATATDMGIPINQGPSGGTCLLVVNRNTNNGTGTDSGLYMVQFYYDGSHTPALIHIAGDNFITIGKTGTAPNETMTLTNAAGGNCSVMLLMNT